MSDAISPGLAKKIRALEDPKPVLEAMGLQLLSLTQDAFNDPAKRAAPWPVKKDGTPARLRRSQALFKAWHVGPASAKSITVENDRPYAAIHQFGGKAGKMPARPMLPFIANSAGPARLADFARQRLQKIGEAKLASLLAFGAD